MVSTLVSALALGAVVTYILLSPQLVDSKIKAGVAVAEERARLAETHALIANDEVERMRTSLAAKGIVIPKGHD